TNCLPLSPDCRRPDHEPPPPTRNRRRYLYGNVRARAPFVYKLLSFAQPTNMLTVQSPRSPPHPPFVPLVFLLLLTIAALNDQHNEESIYFGNHYCYIVKPRVFARRDSLRLSWVHHQVGSL
ncbi:hypothetical protein S245_048892, partial [Arachis hypogaea]